MLVEEEHEPVTSSPNDAGVEQRFVQRQQTLGPFRQPELHLGVAGIGLVHVDQLDVRCQFGEHDATWASFLLTEYGTERLVAVHETLKGLAQRIDVDGPTDVDRQGHIVQG